MSCERLVSGIRNAVTRLAMEWKVIQTCPTNFRDDVGPLPTKECYFPPNTVFSQQCQTSNINPIYFYFSFLKIKDKDNSKSCVNIFIVEEKTLIDARYNMLYCLRHSFLFSTLTSKEQHASYLSSHVSGGLDKLNHTLYDTYKKLT